MYYHPSSSLFQEVGFCAVVLLKCWKQALAGYAQLVYVFSKIPNETLCVVLNDERRGCECNISPESETCLSASPFVH